MKTSFTQSPFPSVSPTGPGRGGKIGTIIRIIKTLVDLFKKPSEEAGKLDQTDSLDNIERITQIFIEFKEQVLLRTAEIEKVVEGEVDYYTEELHEILSEKSDTTEKYGIHIKRIERQIDKLSNRIRGSIDRSLSKKISLDNNECKEIVRMIPGTKKENAMADFFSHSVRSALDECCNELHTGLEEMYSDIEDEMIGTVDSIQKRIAKVQESISTIDENNYEESAKKEMLNAYYVKDVCNLTLELL